jgi:hypothetical protein
MARQKIVSPNLIFFVLGLIVGAGNVMYYVVVSGVFHWVFFACR